MKVMIIGLGSIALKHISVLKQINPEVIIYALRSRRNSKHDIRVQNLYRWEDVPKDINFIIISNPTSEHFSTIQKASALEKPLFIEKPPLLNLQNSEILVQQLKSNNIKSYVAFNLRFHPVLKWLKNEIIGRRILEVHAYCGSYLPEWRPHINYKKSYSGNIEMGGGVHLDLIHELDYIRWIFGTPIEKYSFVSKISDLGIKSPDCAHYWLVYKNMNISVILNYYRKDPKRQMEIVFDNETWIIDLLKFTAHKTNGQKLFGSPVDNMRMYEDQMRYFIDCIENNRPIHDDLENSLYSLKLALSV